MNRKTLCILIALMVLSISACLLANHVEVIFAKIASILNGTPMTVTLAKDAYKPVKTMNIRELQQKWKDHDRKFVRFTGTVAYIRPAPRTETDPVERLILVSDPSIDVYPLDAETPPETYKEGDTYEFTGFLVQYEEHKRNQLDGRLILRLYAFDIRHLDEAD